VSAKDGTPHSRHALWHAALERACRSIAPAWPLDRQIAVSPYWGLRARPFDEVAALLYKLAGAPMVAAPVHYRQAWQAGRIKPAHLRQAIREHSVPLSVQAAVAALQRPVNAAAGLPLLCDILDTATDRPSGGGWGTLLTEQISRYCAAHFDHSLADWHAEDERGLFAGWRASVLADRSLPVRERALRMPREPAAALEWALSRLAIPDAEVVELLQVVALRINGWAAWCAYLRWEAARAGRDDPHLPELLIMRLCWEALLHDGRHDSGSAWSAWIERWNAAQRSDCREAVATDLIWQRAEEIAYQESLFEKLLARRPLDPPESRSPTAAQLVFCIDARSERLRRAVEAIDAHAQTYGFAGFFGLPIRYSPLGSALERAQVPALIAAGVRATDTTGDPARDRHLSERRARALRRSGSTAPFERLPSGSFTTVEMFGLLYLPKLLLRALGRDTPPAEAAGLSARENAELRPCLQSDSPAALAQRADLLAAILRTMSLTGRFSRLLVLVGHGAHTTNNPQASGLACGACGGHSGDVNARLLAGLLNDGALREALAARNIHIPRHTVALAALHDTVADTVELFDIERIPGSHLPDVLRLRDTLARAGARVRSERADNLGLAHLAARDSVLLRRLRRRARDWGETRPEWGLADNAALIVAPRSRTRGVDLQGRAFLHEYRWQDDPDGSVLEQILSAPMIVAHWINMQYYGSTVDPQRFGSGNKVLHNVVGGNVGVLEGCRGDLRIGLARQSVHDGSRWMHTPLRLTVVVDAPAALIEPILSRQQDVRELIEHQWLYLFRLARPFIERYHGGSWRAAHPAAAPSAPGAGQSDLPPMQAACAPESARCVRTTESAC
jgi:uncharacterized protein YbcC (UPF0753/DUF2309 family)